MIDSYFFLQMICQDEDLKDLGVPFGPRKKLIGHINSKKQNVSTFSLFIYLLILIQYNNKYNIIIYIVLSFGFFDFIKHFIHHSLHPKDYRTNKLLSPLFHFWHVVPKHALKYKEIQIPMTITCLNHIPLSNQMDLGQVNPLWRTGR